jgi:hypothetical protein
MRVHILRFTVLAILLFSAAATAHADVCVTIDAVHDTLTDRDRAAAILLVTREFEISGEHVVVDGCATSYVLSHAQLGNTIVVHIDGGGGSWDALAHGMDDLPAVYSQMVRSIVTGRPMTGLRVVDRTNVTAAQSTARRVHTDSIWYARLGYGTVNGDRAYGTPALGFGYRAELDAFALDVAFLNFQLSARDGYSDSAMGATQSLVKLSGLRYLTPRSDRSAYFGGGVSYGRTTFGSDFYVPDATSYRSAWTGSGLQGELTAGYELARATSMRVFVQADATLPFYKVASETVTFSRFGVSTVASDRRYASSFVVSLGLGR